MDNTADDHADPLPGRAYIIVGLSLASWGAVLAMMAGVTAAVA